MAASKGRQPIKYAPVGEVASFAKGLSQSYLLCRELGHSWRHHTANYSATGGFKSVLRCTRCKTERHQELSNRGEVLRNNYDYPDGYQHEGLGRISGDGKDTIRLEALTRILDTTDPED